MEGSAPTNVGFIPICYDIVIEPDLHSSTFKGKVDITIELKKSTNRIRLNSKELRIKSATSAFAFAKREKCRVIENSAREEIEIRFRGKASGRGILHIEYAGCHNDNVYGFSRYRHIENGRKEYVVSTRLEPTGARAVFPCADNPASKAVFDITLIVDKNLEALSNMPVKSRKASGDKVAVPFKRTPPMPTYLLFMAAGSSNTRKTGFVDTK